MAGSLISLPTREIFSLSPTLTPLLEPTLSVSELPVAPGDLHGGLGFALVKGFPSNQRGDAVVDVISSDSLAIRI